MRLPRDLSGAQLIKGLRNLGYVPTRQTGSRVRLTAQRNGEHNITRLRMTRRARAGSRPSWSTSQIIANWTAMTLSG